ncbi:hypothetical protein P261_01815 [Lachnospiraceae bacterium TWA4]|nr:hypothetical protein P261_01815 [Lachnospiraceae bacterium TWA4]
MDLKKLPIGVEEFSEFRENDYYYIDKTGMIKELVENLGKVNLFTRPRRFGKSLTMSMLKYFFEIGTDTSLFDRLSISKEKEICRKYMGQYPVISLTLKQVDGFDFDDAKLQLWSIIKAEAERFDVLQESNHLNIRDKQNMMNLSMGIGNLEESLSLMSRILNKEYQKKVIILIDEYDVPLQKAYTGGYYKEMAKLISQFFGYGMKTNPYMEFAVVTGCLRIAKESIFTGFNNPKIHTIVDKDYREWFGFTDKEVLDLLTYYGKESYQTITKEWYDGYLIGDIHVYCPWDVMNWCYELTHRDSTIPKNFWANSSGNDIIYKFVDLADEETRKDLEKLMNGGSVWKTINFELTYSELEESIENLWSVLFMTGYLTYKSFDKKQYELVLPNEEVTDLFKTLVKRWFQKKVRTDEHGLKNFFEAMDTENPMRMEDCLNILMDSSISYMDGGNVKEKENFYHGMVLGMLNARKDWIVKSNREAGNGRLDVMAYYKWDKTAYIFEFKYANDEKDLEKMVDRAVEQIEKNQYEKFFMPIRPDKIVCYGIAFWRKMCRVKMVVKEGN